MSPADSSNKIKRLKEILDTIYKPLAFASKDSFAPLRSVKGLEKLVTGLAEEALALEFDGATELGCAELVSLFKGFDKAADDARREAVTNALVLIADLGGPAAATGIEDPPPGQAPGPAPRTSSKEKPPKKTTPLATPPAPSLPPPSLKETKAGLKELAGSIQWVKGVGPKLAERLGTKKGFLTIEDLLYHLPFRYEDRSKIKKIKDLVVGEVEVVSGEVMATGEVRYGRRRVFEAALSDGAGLMKLKWFNYRLPYMEKKYKAGQKLTAYGRVSAYGRQKEIIHPDTEPADDEQSGKSGETGGDVGLVPVYSQIDNLHQKTIRKIIGSAVGGFVRHVRGGVPARVLEKAGMMGLPEALAAAHLVGGEGGGGKAVTQVDLARVELARKSVVFDELFCLQLGLAMKHRNCKKEGGLSMAPEGKLEDKLRKLLAFDLTGAQERALGEIKKDLSSPHPMNRLVQGDVGSGKTVVSLIAALTAIEAGHQAAIMAPTEILSEQHFLTVHSFAEDLGLRVVLLTGSTPAKVKRETLVAIAAGEIDLVVGTHALIQKDVAFKSLALAVVDEQHRFGVAQRAALKRKAPTSPDILVMTATPIPRTLSMTVFGDLDVSVIDEMPPGRKPVKTTLLREKERERAYKAVRDEVEDGGQAYIVYPLVEESEELRLKDATNMKEQLDKEVFPDLRVALIHGRMKWSEKERVMRDFKGHEIDILVATTVIEVGVDVPNASVMVIEHAERFGLAQLHQLRGRVGRGERGGRCVMVAAYARSDETWQRLKVMVDTTDGFRIAEEDLKIRGPGDFLGTRQSGLPEFRTAGALGDLKLLKAARDSAFAYLESNPHLSGEEGECVKEVLRARWKGRLELAEVG